MEALDRTASEMCSKDGRAMHLEDVLVIILMPWRDTVATASLRKYLMGAFSRGLVHYMVGNMVTDMTGIKLEK